MIALDSHDVLKRLCETTKSWGLFISIFIPEDDFNFADLVKAAPFLGESIEKAMQSYGQILIDEEGWFLFPDEESMVEAYSSCVGDDGPTKLNPYDGPAKVYALTCSPNGVFLNENT